MLCIGVVVVTGGSCNDEDQNESQNAAAPSGGHGSAAPRELLVGRALASLLQARQAYGNEYDGVIVELLTDQCTGVPLPSGLQVKRETIDAFFPMQQLALAQYAFCGSFSLVDGAKCGRPRISGPLDVGAAGVGTRKTKLWRSLGFIASSRQEARVNRTNTSLRLILEVTSYAAIALGLAGCRDDEPLRGDHNPPNFQVSHEESNRVMDFENQHPACVAKVLRSARRQRGEEPAAPRDREPLQERMWP